MSRYMNVDTFISDLNATKDEIHRRGWHDVLPIVDNFISMINESESFMDIVYCYECKRKYNDPYTMCLFSNDYDFCSYGEREGK